MTDKILFFDTGPIITLVMSRLVWILKELKQKFGGKFYITPAVHFELVQRPLTIKRFQFEALQVMKLLKEGTLELYENVPAEQVASLKKLANTSFSINRKTMDVIQEGELQSVASALAVKASSVVMDERTLRLFIESPAEMESLLGHRFQNKIAVNKGNMDAFSRMLKGVQIIRSIELVGVAYKLGLLDSYVPPQRNGKSILIEAVLWATKFNGCAVTEHEIEELRDNLLQ